MPKTAVALVVVRRGEREHIQQIPLVVPTFAGRIPVWAARTWVRLVRIIQGGR